MIDPRAARLIWAFTTLGVLGLVLLRLAFWAFFEREDRREAGAIHEEPEAGQVAGEIPESGKSAGAQAELRPREPARTPADLGSPGSMFEVELLDSARTPVPGAVVVCFQGEKIVGESLSGASGVASLKATDGDVEIAVSTPGRVPFRHRFAGANRRETVVLPDAAKVSGRVLIEGQVPTDAVLLRLHSKGALLREADLPPAVWKRRGLPPGGLESLESRTDRGGEIRFRGLRFDWRGMIESPGEYFFNQAPGENGRLQAKLPLDRPSTGLTLDLKKFMTVRGRVLSAESGDPVAGAKVIRSLRRESGRPGPRYRTQDTAHSAISADSEGDFRVSIWSFDPDLVTLDFAWPDGEVVHTIDLRTEGLRPDVDLGEIRISPAGRLSLIVRDAESNPIPEGGIFPTGNPRRLGGKSGPDGAMEIAVPARTEEWTVAAPGFWPKALTLSGEQQGSVDVTLVRANALRIEIVSPDGRPLEAEGLALWLKSAHDLFASISRMPRELNLLRASSSSSGGKSGAPFRWSFSVRRPGRIDLPCIQPHAAFALQLVDRIGAPIEEREGLTLDAAERLSVRFVLPRPLRTLRGVVRDVGGSALAKALVWLGEDPETGVLTDSQGTFELPSLFADRAVLRVRKEGFETWIQTISSFLPTARRYRSCPGGSRRNSLFAVFLAICFSEGYKMKRIEKKDLVRVFGGGSTSHMPPVDFKVDLNFFKGQVLPPPPPPPWRVTRSRAVVQYYIPFMRG